MITPKLLLVVVACSCGQEFNIMDVVQKGFINFADLQLPWCEYESCYSKDQCATSPSLNPNINLKTTSIFPCSCDNDCLLFGDCCFDYFQVCRGMNITEAGSISSGRVMSLGNVEKVEDEDQRFLSHKECRRIKVSSVFHLYWFVTRCPPNRNLSVEDINMCESNNHTILGKVPVTLKANPTITFWNFHCARCHGLKRNDIQFWQMNVFCEDTTDNPMNPVTYADVQQLILKNICKVNVRNNENDKPRRCTDLFQKTPTVPPLNSQPFPTGFPYIDKSEELCSRYKYPVKDPNNNVYGNIHCAYLINGPIISNFPFRCTWKYETELFNMANKYFPPQAGTTPDMRAGLQAPTPSFSAKQTMGPKLGSLSIMFNFGPTDMTLRFKDKVVTVETRTCDKEDEVFLPFNERCVKLLCDEIDRKPVNGTCRLKDKVLINGTRQPYPEGAAMFVVSVHIQGMRTVMKKLMERQIGLSLRKYFNTNNNDSNWKLIVKRFIKFNMGENMSSQCQDSDKGSEVGYNIYVRLMLPVSTFVNRFLETYRYLSTNIARYNLTITNFSFKNFKPPNLHTDYTISNYSKLISSSSVSICPDDNIPKLYRNVDLVLNEKVLFAKINVSYFKLENIVFQVTLKERTTLKKVTDVIVCITERGNVTLHCPNGKVSIDISDFKVDNDSLILDKGALSLLPGKFILTEEGAQICSVFSRKFETFNVVFFNYNKIQDILTTVTSSVSMFSLLVVLLVYSLLSELRNVPGKIVMSLSATLLLAQGLQLLITVPTGWLCTTVASLVHTTWLSSFMWMSILSIDLARSIRSMSPVAGVQSHSKLFFHYAGVAWFLPFLFVVVCVLVDYFNVWDIVIGYGSDHLCWISNPWASLYIFGLPVAITLVINSICFVLTLVSIERTASKITTRSKSCKNESTRLGIYVRLSLIMGVSWSFCFAAAFAQIEILWYFQIVLDGLQGLYICFCFVCKSRVRKMLMAKFHYEPKKGFTRQTVTTSTENTNSV